MPKPVDYTGKKIGRLTFLCVEKKGKKRRWNVKCECGNIQSYRADYFTKLKNKGKIFECYDCKIKRRSPILPYLDQSGKKIGRLTILCRDFSIKKKGVWFLCQCDCGEKTTVISQRLTHHKKPTRSCGCYARKLHSKHVNTTQYPPAHGFRKNTVVQANRERKRLYNIRRGLASACYKVDDPRYEKLGANGYTLCELWRNGMKDFYSWAMSQGYEIGKGIYIKNGEKEYGPNTCYLAWKGEMTKINNSKLLEYKGETRNITDWAKKLGITVSCMSSRLYKYKNKYGIEKVMDITWSPRGKVTNHGKRK